MSTMKTSPKQVRMLLIFGERSELSEMPHFYKIGTAGKPWGGEERAAWLALAGVVKRSYADEVLAKLEPLKESFDVEQCVLTFCFTTAKPST
jgi:hypothetical protein